MYSKELRVAIKAAKEAGKITMEYFGKVTPKVKKDKTLVTRADISSERTIRKILTDRFPEYSILGEELKKKKTKSEFMWVVDPLDGTTNFSMQNPLFSIIIALSKLDRPVMGVVYVPFTKELFYAIEGKGAYLNKKRIKVSDETNIKKSFLLFCHGSGRKNVKMAMDFFTKTKTMNEKVRQLGSAGIELCYIASGRADAFFVPGVKPWDIAAGSLIVEEAGGKVTDINGNRYNLYTKEIVASNGRIHRKILNLIKR